MSSSRLRAAVSVGDHLAVKGALQDGADPDTCMPWEFPEDFFWKYPIDWGGKHNRVPVLTVAVHKGYTDVVIALLEAKANPEYRGDFRAVPLGWAIVQGHTDIVEQLLKHGADINSRDSKDGQLPIHYAAGWDHINLAQLLLDRGSCLNSTDGCKWTPLHHAAWWGLKAMAMWLVQQGLDVTIVDEDGKTAADRAETRGFKELATWLRRSTTFTLCSAVSEGDHLGVKRALRNGADPDSCMPFEFPMDKYWKYPVNWGGKHEKVPVLTVAAHKGYDDVITALLDAKANPEYKGDYRAAPLSRAIARSNINIVEQLLNHGADINTRDSKDGELPIHYACGWDHIKIAEMLVSRGSRLDSTDKNGWTPLHHVAWWGFGSMALWLVNQDVNVATVDDDGKTAADRAESRDYHFLATWLRSCEHRSAAQGGGGDCYINNVGRIIFFNYTLFNDHKRNRIGAEEDNDAINHTFRNFGRKYEVIIYDNCTSQETLSAFKNLQQDVSLKQLDCLIIFISSHGKSRHIFYTKDGELNINDLRALLFETPEGCPFLEGKPKIFMANYCQGKGVEEPLSMPVKDSCDFLTSETEGKKMAIVSVARNMKTFFSASEGVVAWKRPKGGNYFIQTFCKVLSANPGLELQQLIFRTNMELETELKRRSTLSEEGSRFNHFYF